MKTLRDMQQYIIIFRLALNKDLNYNILWCVHYLAHVVIIFMQLVWDFLSITPSYTKWAKKRKKVGAQLCERVKL